MSKNPVKPKKMKIPITIVKFTEPPEMAKERFAMLDNLCELFVAYVRQQIQPTADNFLHLGRTSKGDVAISITWDKEKKP